MSTSVADIADEAVRHLELVDSNPAQLAASTECDSDVDAEYDENLYLIGRPPLKGFLRFVSGHAVNPPDEGTLSKRWHTASEVVARLKKEEAGIADNPQIQKLGQEYKPLLKEFLKDPLVKNGFNSVPTEVAMIDLDHTVVYQERIDTTFARRLEHKLGSAPSDDVIFRTCLPYDHPQPPTKWARMHGDKFVFLSPSNDLRYLDAMQLEPHHIADYPPPGSLVGVVGVGVGFGSNFMNAIYAEKPACSQQFWSDQCVQHCAEWGSRAFRASSSTAPIVRNLALVACSQMRQNLSLLPDASTAADGARLSRSPAALSRCPCAAA